MKQIDKAFELNDRFGSDPDHIMFLEEAELNGMFPDEVETSEETKIKKELDDKKTEMQLIYEEIKELTEVDIPEAEEAVETSKGYQLVDARNDLVYAKECLARDQRKLDELAKLISALEERLRRYNHPNMDVYDEPVEFEEEQDTRELDELNRKLYSLDIDINATEECLEERMDYMRKKELEDDLRYAKIERNNVLNRIREIENKQKGNGAR